MRPAGSKVETSSGSISARSSSAADTERTMRESRSFERCWEPTSIELIVVPLPHWRGTSDVFHLMSIISPIDVDLAVVYSPLMPVPFREFLLDRGVSLVEVPDEEFATMGANVLAIAPRRVP